ncbi:MAG: DUF533 domain-containing protein [Candidatus Thiodiazotropha sp.]
MANIDAIKLLGSILNSGVLSRGSGTNILGSVIGAMAGGGSQAGGGGLGSILGSMLGGGSTQSSGGGLGDLLGGVSNSLGGSQSGGGNITDLLGGLLNGGGGGAGLGSLIGAAMTQFGGQSGAQPSHFKSSDNLPQGMDYQQASDQATLLIRAMTNAAKADGEVDREEQQKIIGKLGEVTQDEIDFVRNELSQPLDLEGFVRSIPAGLEQQVYTMSLMAIDLDTQAEAQYLHNLAQATRISPQVSNLIHEQLGAQPIYKT